MTTKGDALSHLACIWIDIFSIPAVLDLSEIPSAPIVLVRLSCQAVNGMYTSHCFERVPALPAKTIPVRKIGPGRVNPLGWQAKWRNVHRLSWLEIALSCFE